MLLFFPACGTCSVSTGSISPAHNMEDVPEGDTNKSARSDCELCVRRRTIYDKEFFYSRENARSLPQPTCTSILNITFFSIMSASFFSFFFLQILCFLSPPDIRHIMGSVPAEQACKLWRQTYKGTAPSSCYMPIFSLAMRKEIFQTL